MRLDSGCVGRPDGQIVWAQRLPKERYQRRQRLEMTLCQGVFMKKYLIAFATIALADGVFVNRTDAQDARYAVVHVSNETTSEMTFYHRWVWHSGTPQSNWRRLKIAPGETRTVHYTYDGAGKQSPDLIVVFDSDRNRGAHWEKVKLTRAASPDFRDKSRGFTYVLRYDNDRQEFASLQPKNGGRVTVLDRKAVPPKVDE